MAGVSLALPSGYIDSPAAAAAAYADGGSSYAANHSAVDVSFTLSPTISFSSSGPTAVHVGAWEVTLTNCDESGATGTTLDGKPPSQFTDEVNVTSGVAGGGSTGTTTCPPSSSSSGSHVPQFTGISEAESGAGASGLFWFNTTVNSAPAGITWGDLGVQVEDSSGNAVPAGPIELDATDVTGACLVATYTFASAGWGAPSTNVCPGTVGGAATILAGAQVSMVSQTNLFGQGDYLVLAGHGAFSGTAFLLLP